MENNNNGIVVRCEKCNNTDLLKNMIYKNYKRPLTKGNENDYIIQYEHKWNCLKK